MSKQSQNMAIINIQRLVDKVGKNTYSYVRVKNMLNGIKGHSTKKEILLVRKAIHDEMTAILQTLDKL